MNNEIMLLLLESAQCPESWITNHGRIHPCDWCNRRKLLVFELESRIAKNTEHDEREEL